VIERGLFVLTLLGAVALIWQVPHLPMVDLPQHVAQIAALRDLWLGTSPWAEELRINYFTPYLLAYIPAALLALLIHPLIAVKLVLSAALLGWVWAGQRALRHFGADERLIWVWLPAWFSLCWFMGFVTFLVAAPLLLLFLVSADRYAKGPTREGGIFLGLFTAVLFFFHALIFCFAGLLGGLLLLHFQWRNWRRLVFAALPYALATIPALIHAAYSYFIDAQLAEPGADQNANLRLLRLLAAQSAAPDDIIHILVFILLLGLALFTRVDRSRIAAAIPLGAMLVVWQFLPFHALGVSYLFSRYSIFFLPFLALVLLPKAPTLWPQRFGLCAVILSCWISLVALAVFQKRFHEETRDFWVATAAIPPQQRILNLTETLLLDEKPNDLPRIFYANWHQVDQQSWVEFNFASFRPQLVRYKEASTKVRNTWQTALWQRFDWHDYDAGRYDYFILLHRSPLPAGFFAGSPCGVRLVGAAGLWSVYAPRRCDSGAPQNTP
jgi:hypothetical protein